MSTISDVDSVNWILTSAAIVLTAGRLFIRISNRRRLFSDDYVHLFALILLIIHGATNQVTLAAKAKQKIDIAPHSGVSQATILEEYHHLHVLNTVNNVFLYGIMWIVKVAFLLMYRQVFECDKKFIRVWWIVLVFVVLSYIPPFVGVVYTCHGATTIPEYKACNSGSKFRNAKLIYTCVLNVVTDVMIMALPLWMLGQLKMNIRQKVGLGLVFCVALFCVALDILRTAEAVDQHQDMYTIVELNVSVIVFCLPTYRRLLADHGMGTFRKISFMSSGEHTDSSNGFRRKSSANTLATQNEHGQNLIPPKQNFAIFEDYSLTDVESHPDLTPSASREPKPARTIG